MRCKYGFDHEKLGVPCTDCRIEQYKNGKTIFTIFDEIDKIQKSKKEKKNDKMFRV